MVVSRRRGMGGFAVVLAALAAATALSVTRAESEAGLIDVKLGINTLTKTERDTLWRRVDEYATVDALLDFCGKKLNLQKRTWVAVSPCVETTSLRKVASVFRAKKSEFLKAWEKAYAEPDKKKTLCDSQKKQMAEYTRILDAHINEARSMCDACLFC